MAVNLPAPFLPNRDDTEANMNYESEFSKEERAENPPFARELIDLYRASGASNGRGAGAFVVLGNGATLDLPDPTEHGARVSPASYRSS
jgi:hypothetical protein